MLRWRTYFFIIAVLTAIFGFGVVDTQAAAMVKTLFFVFIALFLVDLIFGKNFRRSGR